MKSIYILIVFVFVRFCSLLNSIIIEVKQDGTGDYTVIQTAIDNCSVNDTIRVYPGIYFENLLIEGSLSLVSNYEFTGNEEDIAATILDGNFQSSVIRLLGEETSYIDVYICGFIIQHGTGSYHYETPKKAGGGINSRYVYLELRRNMIKNNRTYYGGGLDALNSQILMKGNTFTKNHAYSSGGAILISYFSDITFDPVELNNIYLNYAGKGEDIYRGFNCPFIHVIVDTFTLIDPDFYFVYAGNEFCHYQPNDVFYDIQHAKIEQVEPDLYVSTDGDDNNSGLSPDEPLQNIHYALLKIKADSLHPRTVYVADGLYSPSLNNQYFPLHMKSYVSVIGESRDNTILDAENGLRHIYAQDVIEEEEFLQENYDIKNFKMINDYYVSSIWIAGNNNIYLENIEIANSVIHSTSSIKSYYTPIEMHNIYIHDIQGGRACFISGANGSTVNLSNFKIDNNSPSADPECPLGTGFWIDRNLMSQLDYTVNIINTQITNNVNQGTDWPNPESAIRVLDFADVNLINSTIGNNESYSGGGVVVEYESELHIYNSILYGDNPREIVLDGYNNHVNTLSVQNSLINGGYEGILSIGYNNIYWDDETNLDEDPLFNSFGNYPFALSELSPCIDGGTLDLPEGVEPPAFDLAGNPRVCGSAIDMGAYEFQDIAAPINLTVDSSTGSISWSIPEGNYPTEYYIYLDEVLLVAVNSDVFEYTFWGLIDDQSYLAGISAVYDVDETAIISAEFIYDPVSVSEDQLPVLDPVISIFPNPFKTYTKMKFALKKEGHLVVEIYNVKGQKVRKLMDVQTVPGKFECIWRGKDENDKKVSSGTYFYKLIINEEERACWRITFIK